MQLVTLDFETYFAADYTLSNMTTESYIRDERFKAHCLGLRGPGGTAVINNFGHQSLLALEQNAVICHHAHFDGLILSHHYGIKPAFWFDTLSMARLALPHLKSHSLGNIAAHFGLQEKTVPYNLFKGIRDLPADIYEQVAAGCADDVELTYQIFQRLLPMVSPEELRVIDLTVRMFTEPALGLDRPLMEAYQAKDTAHKEKLLAELGIDRKELASNAKFSKLLENLGVEVPMKVSKTTGKEAPALAMTDDGFKELLDGENETVAALCEARLAVKSTIIESRSQRMLDSDARGPMPVYLKYYGAHTGRWSGGDKMNWQNLKRDSDMRLSITAPEGYVLVVGDLAQIECRMLNYLAGQTDVLDAFKSGRDLYSEGATRFYARAITKADKIERHLGKTLELGCGFGMGAPKFQATCRQGALGGPPILLNDDEAKRAIKSYRDSHPKVAGTGWPARGGLWQRADHVLTVLLTGGSFSWGPMEVMDKRIFYPNNGYSDYTHLGYDGKDFFTTTRKGQAKIYGAKLVENVVQALSRVVLSQAMLKIARRYKIVMCTHDEVVALARRDDAEEAFSFVIKTLSTPPAWCQGIPLAAEGGFDVRYSK